MRAESLSQEVGSGSKVLRLSPEVILSSTDLEVAFVAPIWSVRVPYQPVLDVLALNIRLLAVTDDERRVSKMPPLDTRRLLGLLAHLLFHTSTVKLG